MQMRHFIEQMWRFPFWACASEKDELQLHAHIMWQKPG